MMKASGRCSEHSATPRSCRSQMLSASRSRSSTGAQRFTMACRSIGFTLGSAAAMLFPIDWPEPFGLAMIESMAAGTPAIAFRRGSVPEVIDEGVTGFIVDDVEAAVHAVERVGELPRIGVRRAFESRFGVQRMADEYLDVYAGLLREQAMLGRIERRPARRRGNGHPPRLLPGGARRERSRGRGG